ncbi:hypothetical protein [Marinobacter litoralis]|uniref:hypothetical protein n=1 Tax=Marinobacter litoralis TaxID=187981 RepID=UPI0018EE2DAC|nr:hypothetical protein [Marinobacter litoralis]MBJ6138731.1 hypothetical protein [Marinobacter litoralis]
MSQHKTNTASRLPPAWHPDELHFLEQQGISNANLHAANLTRVKERWIHNTLREVFLSNNGYVLKRYSHFPGRKDYRKVWKREHDALCRLEGLNTPTSKNYISVQHTAGISSTLHVRTLLPGATVSWDSDDDLDHLAKFMSAIHWRYVVTLDPQQENFIRTDNPEYPIGFIDFGRARTYNGMTPFMLINIGKDLAKLSIEGGLTPQQFVTFSNHYNRYINLNPLQDALVRLSIRYWKGRHNRKQNRKISRAHKI